MVIKKISNDLHSIGVEKGDIICIRADMGKIGLPFNKKMDYLESFLDAVGVEGTIIGLAFTSSNFIRRSKLNIFDSNSKSITGAFANLMLSHPSSIRSTHPTNSFVAIGKYAKYITENHDENSGAFDPIRKLIELNAKMILIGCTDTSPGFTTTHLVEKDLGINKKIMLQGLSTVYFKKGDSLKLFRRYDIGCCSNAYYKLYGHYIQHEALHQGYVGNAYTILINAHNAYTIDKEILNSDSKYLLCDNKACLKCNLRWDNLFSIPNFIIYRILMLFSAK